MSSPSVPRRGIHTLGYSFLLVVIAALGASLFHLQSAQSQTEGQAAATVGGEAVSMNELLDRSDSMLTQVETQRLACESQAQENRHQVLQSNLEALVRERLSTIAADKAGMPKADWLEQEKERRVSAVSAEELDKFFADNAGRLRGTREQLEGQVREYLGVENLYAALKEQSEVDILLEPYRLEISTEGSPSVGNEKAKITLVEFSDFECPYCQRFNPTLEQVKETYKDQVRIVFRQFPLNSIHPKAQKAAEASLCAHDQGAFWKMHDLLFDEQKDLDVPQLKEKAERLGLDTATFNQCVDSGKYTAQVNRDVMDGSAAGVTGTPSVFINGRPVRGVVAFEDLAKVIDEELESVG